MPHQQNQPYQYKPSEVTIFAQTNFRNENRRFGIKNDDRRRHTYIIGKTGMGKSTLLENMIIQDIQQGKGVAVVDPHGDLVEKVTQFIPSNRLNDVMYFNPSDLEHPIAFNILESVNPELKNLISNGLVGVFKKIWADSWGPRLEYILINTILALLEYPGSTLLGVTRMLVDPKYRKKVVHNISDPVVRSFWVDEYNNYSEKFRNEAIAPIQNKVGQFLSSALIRNIVGQTKSTIDMREIMDSGKILLMNLAKGRIGEENAALLGAMMITKIQLAAMSRVDVPENERRDFYLYVDEFQNFSTDSFANILSEARKYRLNLIMAHQYIEQLNETVRAAVLGNVGTLITFRVGGDDAALLETEFTPQFTPEDIVNLPAFHIYLRLMIDGVASEPFSATTLPPIEGKTDNREKMIELSRERYGRSRGEVEEGIRTWSSMTTAGAEDVSDDADEQERKPQRGSSGARSGSRTDASSRVPAPPRPPAVPRVSAPSRYVSQSQPPQQRPLPQTPQRPVANVSAAPTPVTATSQSNDDIDALTKKKLSFVIEGIVQKYQELQPTAEAIPQAASPERPVNQKSAVMLAPTVTSSVSNAPMQQPQSTAGKKRKRKRRKKSESHSPTASQSKPQGEALRPQPQPSNTPARALPQSLKPGQSIHFDAPKP